MAAPQHHATLQRDYEIGGNQRGRRVAVVTDSKRVAEFEANEPVLIMPTVSADPAVEPTKGKTFFRDRGDGKMQYCICFPSGAIQIIATED